LAGVGGEGEVGVVGALIGVIIRGGGGGGRLKGDDDEGTRAGDEGEKGRTAP
jgi:hypothetical protein